MNKIRTSEVEAALGRDASPDDVVAWAETNLSGADINAYLVNARCFAPSAAFLLSNAGVTPEQAARQTPATLGIGGYADTIGYKVANGDLSTGAAAKWLADNT